MADASDQDEGRRYSVIDNDTEHDNGFLARERALHPGHLNCHSVKSLVHIVLCCAAGRKIARLRIFGHGHEGSQRVGGGQQGTDAQRFWINESGRLVHRDLLSHWTGHFSPHALVQLHGCEVGADTVGTQLLQALAELWHVRVQAAVKEQHAHGGGVFDGRYIEADGTVRNIQMHTYDDD